MSLDSQLDPQALIRTLGMARHPEGGWYVETFRAASAAGERSAVTAIYFLLEHGQRSHWHTVDAAEIWLWHAGSPLHLLLSADGCATETILLGADFATGQRPQAVVPVGVWQAAESRSGWSLVSCIVAPAFDFAGFRMAPDGWAPAAGNANDPRT